MSKEVTQMEFRLEKRPTTSRYCAPRLMLAASELFFSSRSYRVSHRPAATRTPKRIHAARTVRVAVAATRAFSPPTSGAPRRARAALAHPIEKARKKKAAQVAYRQAIQMFGRSKA